MSAVRNQTELTQNITRLAALWLDSKGFKPVETEVWLGGKWVADVASVGYLTQTELIDLRLLRRPPQSRGIMQLDLAVWRDKLALLQQTMTVLVEVKTTRADYLRDKKRKFASAEPPASLCYIAMPEGVAKDWEYPTGWGVILFAADGNSIRKTIPPTRIIPHDNTQNLRVVHALAIARDHRTRHARLRELNQTVRISDGERNMHDRFDRCLRLVVDVVQAGYSVEDAMKRNYIRNRLRPGMVEKMKEARLAFLKHVSASTDAAMASRERVAKGGGVETW